MPTTKSDHMSVLSQQLRTATSPRHPLPKSIALVRLLLAGVFLFSLSTSSIATPSYSWNLQTDYAYAPAKLAEGSISGGMVSQMNQVDSAYSFSQTTANGSGLNASKMTEIANLINVTFAISRNPSTGALTGRALTVIDRENASSVTDLGQPASFNGDWIPGVNKIIDYYATASAAQQPILEQAYLDMVELFLNNHPFPGWTGADLDAGNGYTWRNTAWKTLRMSNTLPSTERNLFGLSMFFCSGGQRLLKESHTVGLDSSTDDYHTTYKTAFNALTLLDENAFKWQLLNTVRLQLDKSIVGYPETGQNGLITVDGGIIHHTGHHIHYAGYSFLGMILPHRVMTEAGFTSSLTAESVDRFRKAAVAWSWTDTNGAFPVHYNLRPTHPSSSISGGKALGYTVDFLEGAAQLTAAYQSGNSSAIGGDLEMAYPAIVKAGAGSTSLPSVWRSISLPASSSDPVDNWTNRLEGHHTFQVMGGAIHRQNNWMASVRGAHTYRRGGEGYENMGGITHHHEMNMRGSLLLITEGKSGRSPNSADSGYYYQGWDHNFYPNVTTPVKDLIDHLYWRKPAYFSGAATFTGGANLFDNGSWFYVPSDGKYRKSAFFFGNRITLVTSDINYATDSRGIITGLIQQGAPNFTSYPITLNGTTRSGTGSWSLAAGGNHKITDINENGYYIHPGAPAIEAVRGVQGWTYGLSSYWTGPGSMPAYTYDTDFVSDVTAGNFNPTEGNYSTVYFDHGTSAANESLAYTVLVQPSAGELDSLATALNTPGSEPFTLSTASNRHLLHDVATDTYAATLFTAGQTINQGGLISASRAGAYMWRTSGSTMYISCGSSDMGNTSDFVMVVQGEWGLSTSYDTLSPTVSVAGGNTTITLPYRQFAKQGVVLYSTTGNTAPAFTSNPVVEANATQDSAYNGSIADNATDDDGDSMTFSKLSGPNWLSVATNGVLSGTPASGDVGLNSWSVQVSDGSATGTATLEITVNAVGGEGIINQSGWSLHYTDSQETTGEDGSAVNAFDGNTSTIWHTEWYSSSPPYPHEIQIDLGASYTLSKLFYLPRQNSQNGRIAQYQIYLSTDGSSWGSAVASGTWPNSTAEQEVSFAPVVARYVRLVALSEVNGNPWASAAEINLFGELYTPPANTPPAFSIDPIFEENNATEDLVYSGSISNKASDADDDDLTFSKVSGPGWLSMAGSGTISGTPSSGDAGTNSWVVQVSDGVDTDSATLTVLVNPASGEPFYHESKSIDSSYEWIANVTIGSINRSSGDDGGYYDATSLSSTESKGGTVSISLTKGLIGGQAYFYYWRIWIDLNHDGDFVDTDELVYSTPVASSNTVSDSFVLPSTYAYAGPTRMRVSMKWADEGVPLSSESFNYGEVEDYTINIVLPNSAPVFDSDPVVKANAAEDVVYSGSITNDASDSDNNTMTFTRLTGPGWLSVAPSGALSGTPLQSDAGLNSWSISVSDGIASNSTTLEITVDAVNDAPIFDSNPVVEANATKDSVYSSSIADDASDVDSGSLAFAKVSGPGWLSVAGNGALSGTPVSMNVGLNAWVVQVSDGAASNSATLEITVQSDGDWDDDGIADAWELQYFGHETNAAASLDSDEDGYDALSEYIAGFDPTNGLSYPAISGFEVSADGSEWIISWPAETAGRAYDVMSANSLTGTFSNLIGTCVYPQSSYTNAVNPGDTNQFYRIYFRLQP